jgi:hypothetical protein
MTTIGVKVGAVVASGVMADAVIFSDVSYIWLALVGAVVSVFGVAHEVYGAHSEEYSTLDALMELVKGLVLGVLAIPFWFLTLTSLLPGILDKYLHFIPDPSTFTSLSLIVAFGLSWFTVPIFDYVSKAAPRLVRSLVDRIIRRNV